MSDVFLLQVVHKSVLNMAETGTETAATTGWSPVGSALILNPLRLYFNRPFMMIVYDTNTQTPLLWPKSQIPRETRISQVVRLLLAGQGLSLYVGLYGHFGLHALTGCGIPVLDSDSD